MSPAPQATTKSRRARSRDGKAFSVFASFVASWLKRSHVACRFFLPFALQVEPEVPSTNHDVVSRYVFTSNEPLLSHSYTVGLQRPSFSRPGKPVSQPRGVFQGRSERFSVRSGVRHPFNSRLPRTSSRRPRGLSAMKFHISKRRNLLPSLHPISSQASRWQCCACLGR